MRTFRKWLGRMLLALAILVGSLWVFGPREEVSLDFSFDPTVFGDDLDAYFAQRESEHDDITPGTEKRVVWAAEPGARTALSLVYLHGYSATAQEMRPVPELLAARLGANLVYTRLTGHGRDGEAMTQGNAAAWSQDVAEAIHAARAVGEEVVVLSLSTGGTLAAAAALDTAVTEQVKGIAFISPNFGINNPLEPLLTWPAARYWMPFLVGETRSWEPANADQETFWTTSYPSVSVLPMAAMVKAVASADYIGVDVPALFYLSLDDLVVRPDASLRIAETWGQARGRDLAEVIHPALTPEDDAYAHNVIGEILSPNQTEPAMDVLLDWIARLE